MLTYDATGTPKYEEPVGKISVTIVKTIIEERNELSVNVPIKNKDEFLKGCQLFIEYGFNKLLYTEIQK